MIECLAPLAGTRKKGVGRTPGTKEWKGHSCTPFQGHRRFSGRCRQARREARLGTGSRVQDYVYSTIDYLGASFWGMSLAWLCARLTLAKDNPFGGREEATEKGEGVVVVGRMGGCSHACPLLLLFCRSGGLCCCVDSLAGTDLQSPHSHSHLFPPLHSGTHLHYALLL